MLQGAADLISKSDDEKEIEENAISFTQAVREGESALYYSLLYPNKTSQDLLKIAIETNNPNLLLWAIRQGAYGNTESKTPLHFAARAGHAEVVRLLLSIPGINVNAVDQWDETPLHFAADRGHTEVVRLLLAIPGINVNVANWMCRTPLHFAAGAGHAEVVRLLLARGSNVNAANSLRPTPLHEAAVEGHVEVVRLLLAIPGINVNAANNWGNTSLHFAADEGHTEIVRLLLAIPGINVNVVNKHGNTPLHFAGGQGHTEIVRLLLAAGAYFSIKNNLGQTSPLERLITESPIREIMITRYKQLLSEGPVERLTFKTATALFKYFGGKEEHNDFRISELPEEIIFLYHSTPSREKNKGNYFNMRAFCEKNLHLTEEEKEKYGFQG